MALPLVPAAPPLAAAATAVVSAALLLLSAYGAHRVHLLWLYARHRGNAPVPAAPPAGAPPAVTVQLPVFNEAAVVERLIDAACALDWPDLEVQVLDDSTDQTTALAEARAAAWRARGVDVRVLRRPDRQGYKAGALAHGLRVARGELVAVFDADFVPHPGFLKRMIPYFSDPGVGMVQARWGHLNERSGLLPMLASVLLDGHFVIEHTARHRSGRFFNFNGTAGVWRRACVDAAGGWQADTLTEDLDLSYRAQLAGWRFVYLVDEVVPAEIPDTLRAYKLQQHRWAKGTLQTARKLLWPLLRSPQPLRVKLEALVHLGSNLAYPLVVLMAALLPLAAAAPLPASASAALFGLASGSFFLFYAAAQRETDGALGPKLWRIPLVMLLGVGMALSQSRAVMEGIFGRDTRFLRTPKSGAVDGRPGAAGAAAGLRLDWTAGGELLLALWCLGGAVALLRAGAPGAAPWALLYGLGFGAVGVGSLWPRRGA
jgi:cellulose synthase/poly-beta-1,6-N-acetylglucosamine synthase-like glycosyltransferase